MGYNHFTFLSAGELVFGEGALTLLPAKLKSIGISKPLIVTTGLRKSNIIPQVREMLSDCVIYDQVSPEPKSSQAIASAQLAKKHGCDGFVGVGGGSSLDLAKIAAVLFTHGGRPRDYIGESKVPGPVSPIIAVPTTAGSGSEVTSVASVGHDDDGPYFKAGLSDNHLRPTLAVVDPLLLLAAPASITAACGLDALAHAVESFVAVDYRYVQRPADAIFNGGNPIASSLGAQAMQLIVDNLRTAVFQPQNVPAKYNIALGSTLAGLAFGSAGLGAVHASYYAVAEKAGTGHSFTVATMLPHVMRFNAVAAPAVYARIAETLGVNRPGGTVGENATAACDAVARLVADVGLPASLSQLPVTAADVAELAEKAVKHDRLARGNPRRMDEAAFRRLYEAALAAPGG